MSPLRLLFRVAIIFVVIFFAIQPYNWFCALTQSCKPFNFSNLLPTREGTTPLEISLEIKSYDRNLLFEPSKPIITTVAGRKNTVTYHIKNLGKKRISFRPNLVVEPEYVEDYLVRYECLCSHIYRLKPGEEQEVQMQFAIKGSFEKVMLERKLAGMRPEAIRLRYEVRI